MTKPEKDKTDPKVLLDTGQFHLLQKILLQLKEDNPGKEPPGNGQIVVNAEKLNELEKMLNQMKDDMVELSKVKPVSNTGNIYLYLMGIIIVIGLLGFVALLYSTDLDPLVVGGVDFGFVTAIVTLLNNSMVAQKASDRQQEVLLRQEETLEQAKLTHKLVNSGFTEWKETYLAKEYAEGQRAGLHEAEKRADDLKKK